MNLRSRALLLAATVCALSLFYTLPAYGQKKNLSEQELQDKVDRLNVDIFKLELIENKWVYERFIDEQERNNKRITNKNPNSYDSRAILDSVPYLKELNQARRDAQKEYENLYKTDKEYKVLDQQRKAATTKEERDKIGQQISSFLGKKEMESEEFATAYRKYAEARSKYSIAFARWMLGVYQSEKKILPPLDMIPEETMKTLQRTDPQIRQIRTEITTLKMLLLQATRDLMKVRYGTDEPKNSGLVI